MTNRTEERVGCASHDGAAAFLRHRKRLWGIAYGILASPEDADDLVQEAYLRWHGTDRAAVRQPEAWLVTTITRLGIDRLRARQVERRAYAGPWLPIPLVAPAPDCDAEVADGGGRVRAALRVVRGADKVARCVLGVAKKHRLGGRIEERVARINGAPGVLTFQHGHVSSATCLEAGNGRIHGVFRILNPDKLRAVPPLAVFDAGMHTTIAAHRLGSLADQPDGRSGEYPEGRGPSPRSDPPPQST